MGQGQSQEIDNFVNNQVNTNAISDVIANYATRTNAISTNSQDVAIGIKNSTTQGVSIMQNIKSYINVEQLIDRADKTQLVNDLQKTVTTELTDAIDRWTDGLDIASKPSLQAAKNRVLNQLGTYINQTINTSTIDDLLLSSSNYQKGVLTIDTSEIKGPLVFTQDIQSNIMAANIVKQVIDRMVQNKDVQALSTAAKTNLTSESVSPVTTAVNAAAGIIGKNINAWIFYIIGIIVLVLGIIIAVVIGYMMPTKIWLAIIIGVTALVIAVILFIIGFVQSRASST